MPVRPMRMSHFNGALTTAVVKIPVSRGVGQYLRLSNLDGANTVEVSFNGGADFYTIKSGDPPLEVHALFHYFYLRSSVTATYSALVGSG